MESTAKTEIWTENGRELLSNPFLNFCARRRVAFSLIGFIGLTTLNVAVRQTTPVHPFDLSDRFACLALALILVGLAIRSWAAGTLNKSREVTQHGPYALTRNPLYLGSFSMMIGFCILMRDPFTLLFVIGPMAFLYWLQIIFEEKRLAFLFPRDWQEYCSQVPRLLPRRYSSRVFEGWTSFEWLRNREYKSLLASIFGVAAIYAWHLLSPSSS
ncbi:MAG: isoprenylcysteine carboxylmethyltransferase family protein [Planctomycetota bacterium]